MLEQENQLFNPQPVRRGELSIKHPGQAHLARVILQQTDHRQADKDLNYEEARKLASLHGEDPWQGAAAVMTYLREKAVRYSEEDQYSAKPRLERDLVDYFNLLIALDRAAFPPSPTIYSGVPAYIPEGYTSLGYTPQENQAVREVEKIRIEKRPILTKFQGNMANILFGPQNTTQVINAVTMSVLADYPYDSSTIQAKKMSAKVGRTIGLHEIQKEEAAVCRHQNLAAQVQLQALGIRSRPLHCIVVDEEKRLMAGHACNFVQIGSKWHILDVTNSRLPGKWFGEGHTALYPILHKEDPYTSNVTQSWLVEGHHYVLPLGEDIHDLNFHNYYRITDNSKK